MFPSDYKFDCVKHNNPCLNPPTGIQIVESVYFLKQLDYELEMKIR